MCSWTKLQPGPQECHSETGVCIFFFFLIEDVYYFFAGQTEHRWGVHRGGVPCKGMYVAVSWEIVQGVFSATGLGLVCHKHPTHPVLGLKLGSPP